jgi:hypothetical protein
MSLKETQNKQENCNSAENLGASPNQVKQTKLPNRARDMQLGKLGLD